MSRSFRRPRPVPSSDFLQSRRRLVRDCPSRRRPAASVADAVVTPRPDFTIKAGARRIAPFCQPPRLPDHLPALLPVTLPVPMPVPMPVPTPVPKPVPMSSCQSHLARNVASPAASIDARLTVPQSRCQPRSPAPMPAPCQTSSALPLSLSPHSSLLASLFSSLSCLYPLSVHLSEYRLNCTCSARV